MIDFQSVQVFERQPDNSYKAMIGWRADAKSGTLYASGHNFFAAVADAESQMATLRTLHGTTERNTP